MVWEEFHALAIMRHYTPSTSNMYIYMVFRELFSKMFTLSRIYRYI